MCIRNTSESRYSKFLSAAFLIGIIGYIVSIVWFNFNGKAFYIFDVYSDALIAKYMVEERSLFPSQWVFGNQYYVAATPVISALIYFFCEDIVLSQAAASCIMTGLIVISFVWCCKPFVRKDSLLAGLFCLIGAVILGNGICTYKEGLQFLYTLSSFYACYVICFLFTLGAYFRIKSDLKVPAAMYAVVVLLNVAMGMQSPREMLILNIPLLLVEGLSIFSLIMKKSRPVFRKNTLSFVSVMFFAELLGMWFVTLFEINTEHLISTLSLVRSFPEFIFKLERAIGNLRAISGLIYLRQGLTWLPLGLIAVFIIVVMVIALVRTLLKKDLSVPAQLFLFALLSVACVFGVGITVFVSESRYFFIRHVAAAFAFMYLAEKMPDNFWRKAGLTALLCCGAVNLFYNVYPDYKKVDSLETIYEQVGNDLLEQGIDCVLVDWLTHPTVAACSDDKISCMTFFPDFEHYEETGAIIETVVYLRPLDVFENMDPEKTVIMVYDYHDLYMPSFLDQLEESAPDKYMEIFNDKIDLMTVYEYEMMDIYVYTFDDLSIIS